MAESVSLLREPLIDGDKSLSDVTSDICRPLEGRPTGLWYAGFGVSLLMLALGLAAIGYQVFTGIGTWGLNPTVGWAFDITNFVFWIGIGHAGTLISAVLLVFRQRWRTGVNRSAEAMTIFAVMCAGLFPLIHMGRPWLAHWVFPYPNDRGSLWVNWRSPLLWDVFAIGTYFIISLTFWFLGLLPDLATMRDRAKGGIRKAVLRVASLGWNGSSRTWHRYEVVSLLLAGLATPLVFSVHTIVSFDFATSVIPGWHTTIFPPYFVAGAIFSGLSMVLTLMLIARKVMRLEAYITQRHIGAMCKLIIGMGGIVGTAYATEYFIAWYSGNAYERFAFINRAAGPFSWAYWTMVLCNVVTPQLFWFRKVRSKVIVVFILSLFINVGMWFERFVIIVTSLHRDYLPSSWADYSPTLIEVLTLIGSFGLFFTLFLLFCRVLPVIAIAEVKGVRKVGRRAAGGKGGAVSTRFVHGVFADEEGLLEATRQAHERGFSIVDVYTPFPVHGIDRAMGLKPSRLTWVCFLCGAAGALLALYFQFWTSSIDWPINVGGKPFNSLPAFVPIAFEITILFAGLGVVAALLVRCGLLPGRRLRQPTLSVTDDRFVLLLEITGAEHSTDDARSLLAGHGALDVKDYVEEGAR